MPPSLFITGLCTLFIGAMTKQNAINQYIEKRKLFEPKKEEEDVIKNETNETKGDDPLEFSNESNMYIYKNRWSI